MYKIFSWFKQRVEQLGHACLNTKLYIAIQKFMTRQVCLNTNCQMHIPVKVQKSNFRLKTGFQ